MGITEFIEIVAPKLKMPVAVSAETYDGRTLKLTGYKTVKGEPIEDHKLYEIPVPVQVYTDHKTKLRLAFLRGGKNAVRSYLNKFLTKETVEKALTVLDKDDKRVRTGRVEEKS